jgi:predicted NAD/FAD-dependent oxidoreductase
MNASRKRPTVAIVGGGMAGLTTAYTLAKRNYEVTVYEATDRVGGALTAVEGPKDIFDGRAVNFECSPHMFGNWYNNFFALMSEIGIVKEKAFRYCPRIAFLRRGQPSKYTWLKNNGSIAEGLQNLFSGVDTPANLFLYWYTIIDILTQDFSSASRESGTDTRMSLEGFISTRPYVPKQVRQFLEEAMVNIWAVDSYLTSVQAFQSAARYHAKSPTPTAWITTHSNSYDLIVAPLVEELLKLDVNIKTNTRISHVNVDESTARVTSIVEQAKQLDEIPVDNLIIAVPRFEMHPLVARHTRSAQGDGRLCSVSERIPALAPLHAAQGVPLAMVYVPFKNKLPDIPDCYVGLTGSAGSLTFIDLPYLATELGAAMVLAIAISKFGSVPAMVGAEGIDDFNTIDQSGLNKNPGAEKIIRKVLDEFGQFIPFEKANVIWEKVVLLSNQKHRLFLNTVGSMVNAPKINYEDVPNLFFAVETKENPVPIATVEGAVIGGLQAARALWKQNPSSANNQDHPIEPIIPESYTSAELWALKIALTPWAVAAKLWSDFEKEHAATLPRGRAGRQGKQSTVNQSDVGHAASKVAQSAMGLVTAPFWLWMDTVRMLQRRR